MLDPPRLIDQIPSPEVSFHPHSYGDPAGRLFQWNGQLYRGISSEWAPFFRRLLQDGVIQRLVDRGLLIETELTSLILDGYGMVVRHRCVPFASYPNEWCAAMFKDAALTYIELVTELAPHGLSLKDTHPWNILFDAWKPLYVDLTSIIPTTTDSMYFAYDKFRRYYLYPLVLMSIGQERIVRCLLPDYEGITKSDFLILGQGCAFSAPVLSRRSRLTTVLRRQASNPLGRVLKRTLRPVRSLFDKRSHGPKSRLDFLAQVRREVESITLPSFESEPSEGNGNSTLSLSPQNTWTAKQQNLCKILTELRPNSVLDIGSNSGWYSKLAALLGSRVVSFDTDAAHVTRLYYYARDKKLLILPLIMDFTDPTPARGLSSHYSIAAIERFQCDLVLALSLLHHVVFKRHLNFDQIVDGLSLFSKRWLIVEFTLREDPRIYGWRLDKFSWYTLDNFIDTLRRRFRSVSIIPSQPEPHVLLLCEK